MFDKITYSRGKQIMSRIKGKIHFFKREIYTQSGEKNEEEHMKTIKNGQRYWK